MFHSLIFLFFLFYHGRTQQTLFPAAIPLAVRSPYLNCWEPTTNGTNMGLRWPRTYDLDQILGWEVLVLIDGLTYSFLGRDSGGSLNGTVNVTDTIITPTQTVVAAQAGPMQVNLTFLNPIEPGDWVKQSIPFSYMAFSAKSLDSAAHTVKVYSDISGEWNSGDRNQIILWSAPLNSNVVYHTIRLQNPVVFNEISSMAEWGSVYYAMKSATNITFKIARDIDSRGFFVLNGVLDNQTETNFRSIGSNFPVFAISRDLGSIQATEDPVVWTVGLTMDPAVNYTDISGATSRQRSLYYKTQYTDDASLIVDFLNDFANASSRAQVLDQKILQGAASLSNQFGDLVSLATAQVYGSTQLTIGTDASGNYNKSDVMMFMKNIGGSGSEANRVNAVETLYSAFPAFMYIDPTLGRILLEPLFQLQSSPNYTIPYAAADLGSSYPNVTISNSNHNQGVEQSGNMLIMTYAHARASGDGSLISRYYSLLTSWADYLTNSTLLIRDQSSGDGLLTNNQTNLAIKGIIAINAMSKMSSVVRRTADAEKYSDTAASLYGQWKSLALASDQHLLATYGQAGSWTLGYNLFADVWLDTGVVETSVFNGHSSFIDNLALTSSFSSFGLPIDSLSVDIIVAVSSWNLFVAAMTPNQDLRTDLISRVHNRASSNVSAGVFPLSYDSARGSTILGAASPAQGAMYAPLALTVPIFSITANATNATSPSQATSRTGAIAGGVAGGAAALIFVVWIIAFVVRRRRRQGDLHEFSGPSAVVAGPQMTVTPFNTTLVGATVPLEAGSRPGLVGIASDGPSEPPIPPSQSAAPVPVGLTSKELAQLRSAAARSPTHPQTSSSESLPIDPPPNITTEQSTATPLLPLPETRRLQTQIETLRLEMQELRGERFEAPPSYGDGGGV